MEEILLGTTDRTILVFIADPSSTDGSGKTGLLAADLTASYTRAESDNDVALTDVTASLNDLSALTDPHSDWGWKEVSSSLAPGLYRFDIADAVFASGAWYAAVYVMITSSSASATPKGFRLVDFDPQGTSGADLKDFVDNGYDPTNNWVNANVVAAAGTATYASDFTIASATSTTVTLPTTDSAGNSIPDDDRYIWCVLHVVGGTGVGQVVCLTTAGASARQYNVLSGTMPVQLDNTSQCVVTGSWRSSDGSALIADSILTRSVANVEDTAAEHTLCTVVLAMLEHSISGTTLTIKKTDGTTTYATKTLTTTAASGADVITGVT